MKNDPNSKPLWFNKDDNEEKLNKNSLFVATPVHSEVSIHYTQSLLELQKLAIKKKTKIVFQLYKSSLVTQGRNLCVSAFLRSGMSHLLFIDSDIGFKPESAFRLLDAKKDVISVPYALKDMCWDKALYMIKNNKIKTVDDLKYKAFYRYPFKVANAERIEVKDGAIEVTHSPTGFMMIKRSVFEKMIKEYPDFEIVQDNVINGKNERVKYFYNFFDTLHDPKTKTYLGEDFAFCKRWRDIGGKCYCLVNDYISHIGEHQYTACFADELIKEF